jgi:hypothetical protein
MSVTFSLEAVPTGKFVLSGPCAWDEGTEPIGGAENTFESFEAATAALVEHKTECSECDLWGCHASAVMDVDVEGPNVSNANARMLLSALDLDADDLCGIEDGAEFLARVNIAMAMPRDDSGVRTVEDRGVHGLRWIDCSMAEGQWAEWFAALADLATEAARLGREVQWS